MNISIIIPTLNEERNLEPLLARFEATPGVHETIIADGGSTDATQSLAAHRARLTVSEAGRGAQLRAGARVATGDVLLFLHADVAPPENVAVQIIGALEAGYVGGNFRLRYPEGGALGRWLELLAPVYRRLGRYYGDSGLFVRRDAYEAFGGFPAIPVMEDIVFVRRMERHGPTAYLPGPMVSSARRWRGRALRTLLLWGGMQVAYALGVSPWKLDRFYRANSKQEKKGAA
ncbi:MAG: TIGR04283 family arsenosugar biosynthesis glycosyltransferase [Rubrobacteraceae bacterium]